MGLLEALKNIGKYDRAIRVFISSVLFILVFFKVIEGGLATFASVLAGVMLITSFTGFCLFYKLIGKSTCQRNKA